MRHVREILRLSLDAGLSTRVVGERIGVSARLGIDVVGPRAAHRTSIHPLLRRGSHCTGDVSLAARAAKRKANERPRRSDAVIRFRFVKSVSGIAQASHASSRKLPVR